MACAVTESVRTVEFAILEPGEVDARSSAYPLPPLSISSGTSSQPIPVLLLENDFLRVEIAPSLGGRILEILDKVSGTIVLATPQPLSLVQGGRRGVSSPFGIQLSYDGFERQTALGPVDWTIDQSEEEGLARVTIAENSGWPVSFHCTFELNDGIAELGIEAKFYNRALQSFHYNAGLLFPETDVFETGDQLVFYRPGEGGLRLNSSDLSHYSNSDGKVVATRFDRRLSIAPQQLDTWTATIYPLPAHSKIPALGEGLSLFEDGGSIHAVSTRPLSNLKILVQIASGETLEANVSIEPVSPLSIPLREQDLPLLGFAVLDSERRELIRSVAENSLYPLSREGFAPDSSLDEYPDLDATPDELRVSSFKVGTRSLSHLLLALRATQTGDWELADYQLEQTLLYNGEDYLAWWLKARCGRLADPDNDVSAELLNAHYLAPLEPILRAEALLNQPISNSGEPNPMLTPYADDRDATLDSCGQLIQAGLIPDAMRLISEWMRVQDFPMLRYLLGYCYLTGTRMTVEAAEQLRVAGTLQPSGPYPIRPIELKILNELSAKWPNDLRLAYYVGLARTSHEHLGW